MGRRKGSGGSKKDPFLKLDEGYRDTVQKLIQQMKYDEVDQLVAKVAKDNQALQDAKKQDQDLKSKSEAYREAGAVYRESASASKLKIRYARAMLEASGKESGTPEAALPSGSENVEVATVPVVQA